MSAKNLDRKGRLRNKTVAFRMSEEESRELDHRWRLCGFRTKQDYLIQAALYCEVKAYGMPMMFVQFRKDLQRIEMELTRIDSYGDLDEELMAPIHTMLEILEAFERKGECI